MTKGKDNKICLFGGTFNPIHLGHLILADEVSQKYGLDTIIFVPTNFPPHKDLELIPAQHRLEMVNLAIRGNLHFEVSEIEINRAGISYSIDTVRYFKEKEGYENLHFLVGLDAFLDIETWRDYRELLKLCTFLVMNRPGYGNRKKVKQKLAKQAIFIDTLNIEISGKLIRERIRNGQSIKYLVTPEIESYIRKHDLYL